MIRPRRGAEVPGPRPPIRARASRKVRIPYSSVHLDTRLNAPVYARIRIYSSHLFARIWALTTIIDPLAPRRGSLVADDLIYRMLRREEKRLYMLCKRRAQAAGRCPREYWAEIVAQIEKSSPASNSWQINSLRKPDVD